MKDQDGISNQSSNHEKQHLSVTGWYWKNREFDNHDVVTIMQRYNLPEFIARLLAGRKHSPDELAIFLDPTIKELLPDPTHLLDMNIAAERLSEAVMQGHKVLVFGDYDVDGATSSALIRRYFKYLGQEIGLYIPNRITEGYGPNPKAMETIKKDGYEIVVTVDCGSLSFEALEHAKKIDLEVIVVDHHLSDVTLPEAVAIVNPNRYDQISDFGHLAAVGVAFLLLVEINRKLENKGWFVDHAKPNLLNLLDIVALGTVCDMVPITGINRAFVKQGLKLIRTRSNVGMKKLAESAKLNEPASCYHLGYILGPRINAGGRVGKANLGSDLLSTDDEMYAADIALQLESYNNERKAIEVMIFEEALKQAEEYSNDAPLIIVKGEHWHPGVVGVVCGRLKEKFNKPIAVISINNGVGKASARSVDGIDFGTSVVNAKNLGLLISGGGHAMAAGFTFDINKFDEVYKNLAESFTKQMSGSVRVKLKHFDSYLSISAINKDTINYINQLAPFGIGNSEPCFLINDCLIMKTHVIAETHVKCMILNKNNRTVVRGTAFKAFDNDVGKSLIKSVGKEVALVAKLKSNFWNGVENIELSIEDVITK